MRLQLPIGVFRLSGIFVSDGFGARSVPRVPGTSGSGATGIPYRRSSPSVQLRSVRKQPR